MFVEVSAFAERFGDSGSALSVLASRVAPAPSPRHRLRHPTQRLLRPHLQERRHRPGCQSASRLKSLRRPFRPRISPPVQRRSDRPLSQQGCVRKQVARRQALSGQDRLGEAGRDRLWVPVALTAGVSSLPASGVSSLPASAVSVFVSPIYHMGGILGFPICV